MTLVTWIGKLTELLKEHKHLKCFDHHLSCYRPVNSNEISVRLHKYRWYQTYNRNKLQHSNVSPFDGTSDVTKQIFVKQTCKQSVKGFCGSKCCLQHVSFTVLHLHITVSSICYLSASKFMMRSVCHTVLNQHAASHIQLCWPQRRLNSQNDF